MSGTRIPISRRPWPQVSVVNDRYLRQNDIFDKRHRLNMSLGTSKKESNEIPTLAPVKTKQFKMRVKQLQIGQQFTPEYYLRRHLPSEEEQRAYFCPSPGSWSHKNITPLPPKGKKEVKKKPLKVKKFNTRRRYPNEGSFPKKSLRRKVRNAVESNKSLLVVSSICFLAGTLILISSLFSNDDRENLASNNTSIIGSDTGSDAEPKQQPSRKATSMTLFGFTFIGIGFSILSLSLFLIVCCHVNKWLAIETRPSSLGLRSDSTTSLIPRRKTSIEDCWSTKIAPEPFSVKVDPGQIYKHRGQDILASKILPEKHQDVLIDIETIDDENKEDRNKSADLVTSPTIAETNKSDILSNSTLEETAVKLKKKIYKEKGKKEDRKKDKKKDEKKDKKKDEKKQKEVNERKNKKKERRWIN